MKYLTTVNDQQYEVEVRSDGVVLVNGEERRVDFRAMGDEQTIFSLIIDNQSFEAVVEQRDGKYHVMISGDLYEVAITDERSQRLAKARGTTSDPTGEVSIKSPMPGLIVKVLVAQGDEVKKGQTVIILESMKMENELKSPRDGIVHTLNVKQGDSVEQNKTLISIG